MNPGELHVELLHACPLNCAPCDHRLAGGARLPLAALKRLFLSPRLKGLRLVSFSGGEPTLHPDFGAALLAAARAFPAARLIVLSGLYEPAVLEEVLRGLPPAVTARLHIGSSLDGPPRLHDRIRGRAGAFARLKAAHARIKKEHPGISTGFTFTASALNAHRFYETWRTAVYTLKAPLGVQFLVPNPNSSELKPDQAGNRNLAAGLLLALAEMRLVPAAGHIYSAGELQQLELALAFLRGAGKRDRGCGAGRTFAMLSPEGRFYLCPFHKEAYLGSINSRFGDIWNAGNAAVVMKKAGAAACAGCFLRCALSSGR